MLILAIDTRVHILRPDNSTYTMYLGCVIILIFIIIIFMSFSLRELVQLRDYVGRVCCSCMSFTTKYFVHDFSMAATYMSYSNEVLCFFCIHRLETIVV